MPTEIQVTFDELRRHLAGMGMPREIDEIIVHHTEAPTAAQYQGLPTITAIRRFHMEERGWSDCGYHLMVGPPGDLFLCRPLEREGAHTLGHNEHSVGLAYVANFDLEDPATYPGLALGQRVVVALLRRFGLGIEAVRFHREFAEKTCPGRRLDLEAYRAAAEGGEQ